MRKLTNYIIICVAFASCVQKVDVLEYSCTSVLTSVNGNTCTGNDTTIYEPSISNYEVFSDDKAGIDYIESSCNSREWTETSRIPTSSSCESFSIEKTESVLTKLN